LVDDDGVGELVVRVAKPAPSLLKDAIARTPRSGRNTGIVHLSAGCELPEVIVETVRAGWAGLEGLGGIPASLGGAIVMNAGGAFGQIADAVHRVHALDRFGAGVTLGRSEIDFSYRHSGLNHLVISAVELAFAPGDPAALRVKLKDVMAYKKGSQPLADNSA